MNVYIFIAKSLRDIQKAIDHKTWAVEDLGEPRAWARLGRSRQMAIGAAGLFYCSAEPQLFTTPFIVESRPEETTIAGVWDEVLHLPFTIRPLGDLTTQILYSHAKLTWPNLKSVENTSEALNLLPDMAFTPTFIPRYDWDLILEQLNIDPETYEELFSPAGAVLEK
jgi:hypothetical protein